MSRIKLETLAESKLDSIALAIENTEAFKNALIRNKYITADLVVSSLLRFVRATEDGSMYCIIHSTAKSGMSRVMSFHAASKKNHNDRYTHLNFWTLLMALGYPEAGQGFRIGGGGMDMVFATHYNIIHTACNYGIITDEQCALLAQMTPTRYV